MVKIETAITDLKEKKAKVFEQFFRGEITESEFRKQNEVVSSEITAKQDALSECRRIVALGTK